MKLIGWYGSINYVEREKEIEVKSRSRDQYGEREGGGGGRQTDTDRGVRRKGKRFRERQMTKNHHTPYIHTLHKLLHAG